MVSLPQPLYILKNDNLENLQNFVNYEMKKIELGDANANNQWRSYCNLLYEALSSVMTDSKDLLKRIEDMSANNNTDTDDTKIQHINKLRNILGKLQKQLNFTRQTRAENKLYRGLFDSDDIVKNYEDIQEQQEQQEESSAFNNLSELLNRLNRFYIIPSLVPVLNALSGSIQMFILRLQEDLLSLKFASTQTQQTNPLNESEYNKLLQTLEKMSNKNIRGEKKRNSAQKRQRRKQRNKNTPGRKPSSKKPKQRNRGKPSSKKPKNLIPKEERTLGQQRALQDSRRIRKEQKTALKKAKATGKVRPQSNSVKARAQKWDKKIEIENKNIERENNLRNKSKSTRAEKLVYDFLTM